jgi:hypothetical protein
LFSIHAFIFISNNANGITPDSNTFHGIFNIKFSPILVSAFAELHYFNCPIL